MRRAAPVVWVAYLVVPVGGWGLFAGRPLDALATLAIAALGWVWYSRGEAPAARTATVALALKIVLGATVLLPAGFAARYYPNADFSGAIESGTEPSPAGFTRVDTRLRFGSDRGPDLPVHFTNDVNRFNFYLPGEPDRATVPVSVAWDGQLRVTEAGSQHFYARASGATVAITIDDRLLGTLPASLREWRGNADLSSGFHHLVVRLSIPQGASRRFEAGRIVDGREQPFDRATVFRRPASLARIVADRFLRVASVSLDLVLLLWLLVQCGRTLSGSLAALRAAFRPRDALVILWALVVADALVFAWPVFDRVMVLSGGDDWLTYETMSRDIGLNGLWMAGGAALGHGRSFYYQPLYPYFLAACHWVFGDGLFGIYFAQRLLAGAAVVALWRTTALLFGERVGLAGLVAALVVVYQKLAPWSGVLLTESLFAPVVCIWTLMIVRLALARAPTWSQCVTVGVAGGIATLTRSTLILGWVLALPTLAFALRDVRKRWSMPVVVLLAMLAVVSLATVRNWVVARELVLITSSGSVNLFSGNEPKVKLQTPPARARLYGRVGLDAYTQMVVEYARQKPGAFLDGLRRKAAYTLGSFDSLLPGTGRSSFYAIVWASALAGLLLVPRVAPAAFAAASAMPILIAAAHFAAVVAIFPHVYGDRLVLPFYLLLVPYVAVALVAAARLVRRVGIDPRTAALCAVTWLAAIWVVVPRVDLDLPVTAMAIVCVAMLLADRGSSGKGFWPCAVFSAALSVTLLMAPSSAATIEYRRQLAFAALVPAVASLAGSRRVPALVVGGAVVILAAGAALWSDAWIPLLASLPRAIDRVPMTLWAAPLILAAAALFIALRNARRTAWAAMVALVAGAGLMLANLQRFAASRVALDTIDMHVAGWPAAAALFGDHRWFGAGLDTAATLSATHVESGGAMLWFLVSAGSVGSLAYLFIWLRALWVSGGRLFDWRAAFLHGMLLGAFAALQTYNVAGGTSAAPGVLLLLGVILGLSESSDVSTLGIEPRSA